MPAELAVFGAKNATTGATQVYPGDLRQIQDEIHDPSLYQLLDSHECVGAYAETFLYDRSDVIVVTEPIDRKASNETCPTAQGHPYKAENGDWFVISCNSDATGLLPDLCSIANTPCPSVSNLTECLNHCANATGCNAATFLPQAPGPAELPQTGSAGLCVLKPGAPNVQITDTHMGIRVQGPPSPPTNSSVFGATIDGYGVAPFNWMCPSDDTQTSTSLHCRQKALANASDWSINDFGRPHAARCYSKLMPQHCRLKFSVLIGGIVTLFNFLKLLLCLVTFFVLRKHTRTALDPGSSAEYDPLLVTAGDAIVSYLREADCTTKNICLAEKIDFEHGLWNARWVQICSMKWRVSPHRSWFRTIGLRRWILGSLW